jgi:uncharacterized linocin/CFP29 family protein
MQKLQFVGTDAQLLTTEQYQMILDEIVTAARKPLVGRTVMPLQDHPWEVSEVKYYTQTDMNAAAIGMAMVQGNEDVVSLTGKTKSVPVIWKDFKIFARDLAASQRTGIPLDTSFASDAGRRVSELEEALIWEGAAGFEGFMGLTGRDTNASTGAWSTAGNAYIDVRETIAQLQGNGFMGPYTLIVSPAQYADLLILFASTGITQLTQIQALCRVAVSAFFADNANALLVDADKANFELRYSPLYTHNALTQEGDYFFRVYEAALPFFKSGREKSVVDITGITV